MNQLLIKKRMLLNNKSRWRHIKILSLFFNFLAMSNQDTLMTIQRGYRLERPNYPGQTTENLEEELDGIYGVS